MNREDNKYINEVGEILDATEMNKYVISEAKRQYEECSGLNFDDLAIDEKSCCILSQWDWQLDARGWKVINIR